MKICITCHNLKVITDFPFRKDTQKHRNECIECHKNRHSKYRKIAKLSTKEDLKQRICSKCKTIKIIDDFYRNNLDKYGYRTSCKSCDDEDKKIYIKNNKEKISLNNKARYSKNRDTILVASQAYYLNNRYKIIKRTGEYYKYKRNNNICFKLKTNVSRQIHHALRQEKSGRVTFEYLGYSLEELKYHLENLFEPWMTWSNYGKYVKSTWNDNDSSTWTWNIDHIIPHSMFKYNSMEDKDFIKCWALENLRPYSSKQNILDNNKRDFK